MIASMMEDPNPAESATESGMHTHFPHPRAGHARFFREDGQA